MKKLFLLVGSVVLIHLHMNAQDIIRTNTGEEIKTRLLKFNKKGVIYKPFDDPEFNTFNIPYNKLASVKYQDEKKPIYCNHKLARAFIGLTFGPMIPLGSFAAIDYESTDKEPGFAQRDGLTFDLDAGFYLYRNIGLSIGIGRHTARYDTENYASIFNGTDKNTLGGFYRAYSPDNIVGTNNRWIFTSGLIGPMYSIKFKNWLTWDLLGRVGVISTTSPEIVLEYDPYFSQKTFYTKRRSERTNFGYQFGTNFRVMFTKRLSFVASANYLHTSPDMNIEYNITTEPDPEGDNYSIDTKYNISFVTINLGFAFQFKRKGNKYE